MFPATNTSQSRENRGKKQSNTQTENWDKVSFQKNITFTVLKLGLPC